MRAAALVPERNEESKEVNCCSRIMVKIPELPYFILFQKCGLIEVKFLSDFFRLSPL